MSFVLMTATQQQHNIAQMQHFPASHTVLTWQSAPKKSRRSDPGSLKFALLRQSLFNRSLLSKRLAS